MMRTCLLRRKALGTAEKKILIQGEGDSAWYAGEEMFFAKIVRPLGQIAGFSWGKKDEGVTATFSLKNFLAGCTKGQIDMIVRVLGHEIGEHLATIRAQLVSERTQSRRTSRSPRPIA